jgi:hypothetical protein
LASGASAWAVHFRVPSGQKASGQDCTAQATPSPPSRTPAISNLLSRCTRPCGHGTPQVAPRKLAGTPSSQCSTVSASAPLGTEGARASSAFGAPSASMAPGASAENPPPSKDANFKN